jgi:hypothetical protein
MLSGTRHSRTTGNALRDQTNNAHGCFPQIAIAPPTIALQNIHN